MDGIININKPRGMPSFRCMSAVKRRLGLDKVGFLGTLDPAACGVLVLLCGKATKLADRLHQDNRKVYQAEFTFGLETDTLDGEGIATASSEIIPAREQIEKILPQMTGSIEIEVPKFSAVHIGGKRAYDLARKGVEFTAPKRTVEITRFELLDCPITVDIGVPLPAKSEPNKFYFEIECSAGTYIRSLAKLLAQKLGTLAIASIIVRTRVGEFGIEDSVTPDNVTADNIINPPFFGGV